MSIDPVNAFDPEASQPATRRVYSVTEITQTIRFLLEDALPQVWIEGEISNCKRHTSGHLYFSLKDAVAQVACVMWRGKSLGLPFEPRDGMQVIILGSLTVYERQGKYQIDVHRIRPAGSGMLQEAFERLKRRLAEEGLFDPARKRPIPEFPRRIGIVTSATGAALQDIRSVIDRRFGDVHLILTPVSVQGETAAEEIAHAIRVFNTWGNADVLIVGRGGGSVEDLQAFNQEIVARAIFESGIPVISAVGHDIDFSISDFVADLRAPTPSAAAELVVPDREALRERIRQITLRMTQAMTGRLAWHRGRVEAIGNSWAFRRPGDRVREYRLRIDDLSRQLELRMRESVNASRSRLDALQGKLGVLDPGSVLARGYSITTLIRDGRIVRDAAELRESDSIRIRFARGAARSIIQTVEETCYDGKATDL